MRKSKKFLALLTALSISASAFAGLATTVSADETTDPPTAGEPAESTWTAPKYGADAAVHSNSAITVAERDSKIGGADVTLKYIGSISGGISGATSAEYNNQTGGTATFTVTAEAAGDYDVTVTCLGAMSRRIDLAVGETVYAFATDVEADYGSLWTKISDEGSRDVFTYTFEDVVLAAGENALAFGTKVDQSWAPDIVGIDVESAVPAVPGIVYKNGKAEITYTEAKAAKLIVAKYYDNNTLNSIDVIDVALEDGTVKQEVALGGAAATLMVWDDMGTMVPLFDEVCKVSGKQEAAPTPIPPTSDPSKPTEAPTPDLKTVVLNEKFTSDTVTDPTNGSYTWGDIASMLANKKGLLLTNANSTSNNYENKDIVTFTNPVGDTENKVDISYNVAYQEKSKGQEYSNFTISYYNENDKFMFSITESIGNWADKAYIEYADSDTTTAKEEVATNIGKAVNAEVKFGKGCGYLTIGGKMYRFVTDGTLKSVKTTVSGGQDYNRGIYITNYKMTTEPSVLEEYCLVTYDIDGKLSTDSVVSGNSVTASKVPATAKKGYIFNGWQMNDDTSKLYTTDEIKAMKIEADVKFTAKYHEDETYVQSIASVEFIDASGNAIVARDVKAYKYPTEAEAVEYKPYEIKVTSDIGNDITADCEITWNAVGGGGADANYFAFVEKKDEDIDSVSSKRYARIRQGGESWFGYIKADVVYNPANSDDDTKNTTGSAQIPCAVLTPGNIANQILPAEGYPVSMDYYVDDIVSYKSTSDDYSYGYDPVLNNWCIVGSLPTRDLLLVKDGDKKALKFTKTGGDRGGSGASCVGTYAFPTQKAQYVFETIVKFEGATRIGVWDKTPNQGGAASEWAVSYDGSEALTAGEEKITGISKNTWYKLVVTSDPANKLYSVYAYTEDGTSVGSITGVAGGAAGKFLCIDDALPVYINSIRAYVPELDTISITADNDVIGVPDAGAAANEVALRAICKTADGYDLTGAVEWNLAEEYDGIELVKGTQTATLKVTDGASGTIKVTASMSGKTAEKEITVTSSKNRVAFTTKSSSITIPFEGSSAATGEYLADTITPESPNGTNDKKIAYTFLDKTGAVTLDTLPNGITSSVDTETNKLTLTVAAGATPAVFYVKATQTEGDGLSAKTLVNVHGLNYSFGTEEVEGDTQVTSASLYTDTLGYGFESTTGLTDAADKVTGTAAYKFKAKVPNGNYKVTVNTTSASMQSEIIDDAGAGANVAGITKTGNSFNVAVCDEVLDLTFLANSSVSSLSIAQIAAQESREKPKVYAVGDSTTQNEDNALSWGSYMALHGEKLPEAFSSFSNNGKSGANSISFYDRGLMETVLLDIHEGDYVTVNMGVNWVRDGKNDTVAYEKIVDNYFVKAIIDRGGIPVITTSTPLGYNADPAKDCWTENADGTFTCNRTSAARNPILRKIAVKYDLNIIELSYYGESYFNSLTMDDVNAYNAANGTSFTSVVELARSWWNDHNHYKEPLAVVLSEYMMDCLNKIAGGDESFHHSKDPHINEQ